MNANRKCIPTPIAERIGRRAADIAQRLVPDPFVIALCLSLIAIAAGAIHAGFRPALGAWAGGFFDLLKFGMQMCLILATGHALAVSPPCRRALTRLADVPNSSRGAVFSVGFAAAATGLINWGLGLIFGALLARETAARMRAKGIAVHYPAVAAAGYLGLAVWHGGLSGSAPLDVATPGHRLASAIGVIPIERTLYSPSNLACAALALVLLPLTLAWLTPASPTMDGGGPFGPAPEPPATDGAVATPDEAATHWMDRAWLSRTIGGVGAAAIAFAMLDGAFRVTLDTICFVFLFLGLILHRSPTDYANAIGDAGRGLTGIVLQFPFYAGILGVLKGTGLLAALATWFAQIATPGTFLPLVFVSSATVNLFVPSGGGQWAVQGPIVVDAAQSLGIPVDRAVMALAYGDQLTNLLQPFWALPLLAITGAKARDILGYTALVMIAAAALYATVLVAF